MLQDNFVAELSTHYQNYILFHSLVEWVAFQASERPEEAGHLYSTP